MRSSEPRAGNEAREYDKGSLLSPLHGVPTLAPRVTTSLARKQAMQTAEFVGLARLVL